MRQNILPMGILLHHAHHFIYIISCKAIHHFISLNPCRQALKELYHTTSLLGLTEEEISYLDICQGCLTWFLIKNLPPFLSLSLSISRCLSLFLTHTHKMHTHLYPIHIDCLRPNQGRKLTTSQSQIGKISEKCWGADSSDLNQELWKSGPTTST